MKIDLLNPKTLLKNVLLKHLKRFKILLLKTCWETTQMGGYLYPIWNLPVGSRKRARIPIRSTGQRSKNRPLSPPVDRPVDRAQNQRATPLWPVDRPVDRANPRVGWLQSVDRTVDRPSQLGLCARLVHIGRPVRSTARAWQLIFRT